jgi:hypothetical protein
MADEVLVGEVVEVVGGLMPITELEQKSTALSSLVSAQDAQDAGFYLRVVRQSLRNIKATYAVKRKELKNTIKEAVATLDAEEERRKRPFELAETQVDTALIAWRLRDRQQVEVARQQQLEAARTDEEARRAATVATLTAQAATAKGVTKTMLKAQATALALAPLTPQITAPMVEETKIAGVPLIEYWSADVTDLMLLVQAVAAGRVPLAALQADQQFLDAQADAYGKTLSYPGVVAVSTFGQTARGL